MVSGHVDGVKAWVSIAFVQRGETPPKKEILALRVTPHVKRRSKTAYVHTPPSAPVPLPAAPKRTCIRHSFQQRLQSRSAFLKITFAD